MKRFAILAIVAAGAPALADPFAETAYKQAEDLRKAGKWDQACPLYQASYQADAQLGVLLHLADCHEHVGMIATAWAEFSDAVELAHKKQDDKREVFARGRADALAPKVPKLRLAPPKQLIPGLVVRRDTTDITLLVGTDMPIDPGDHEVSASAPGYVEWKQIVKISTGTTPVEIPVLDKIVVKPVEVAPVVHEGTVKITTDPHADILLDAQRVGTGTYEAKVKSGGHTLRVVAAGMRPYQSEIFVADGDVRTIDVPLEHEPSAVVVAPPPPLVPEGPREDLPSFELGLSVAPGSKRRADNPAIVVYRAELALRLGRRVNLGVFVDAATISTSGSCGTDSPGSNPSTPFDFGQRNQMKLCRYIMPGLQLYIHILPKHQWDPYLGITPGFRFGTINYTPYLGGQPMQTQTSNQYGIAVGYRAGVDYHPSADYPGWVVGTFVDVQDMVVSDEQIEVENQNGGGGPVRPYVSVFGGLRTTYQF